MTGSEKRDGSAPPPTGGDARSPSPGDKSTVTEEPVPDQDVTADTSFTDNHQLYQPMCTDGAADDPAEDTNSNATGSNGHAKSDSVYPTPSSMAAYTSSASTRRSSKVESMTEGDTRPSFDDQVAKLNLSIAQPLVDKQKGYVVSMNWLSTVFSRSSVHADKVDKSAAEGKIGPVNSVDIVLDTEPSAVFKDEADEPFVPLRPNLRKGADFEIVPQEGWDLMMKWYGLADESPAIVRYAHNTTSNEGDESVQYEINPPIFTVVKLANPSALTTPQSLKEKIALPVKFMATRATNVQQWLTQAKQLANIDMSVKVRIWTIRNSMETTSTALTPASSRTPSPAPSLPSNAKLASNLVLDLNMFLSVPEGQRQLLTDIKDQTTNPNYNGSMTLGLIGLGENEEILVLEEYIAARGGGDWISEAPKQTLERLGVPAGTAVTAPAPKPKKIAPTNVKSAPAQRPTRGRAKISKPRGCIGLKNLSNTCYMNSALQCMRNVEELSHYFLSGSYKQDLNPNNPLSYNGDVANEYAKVVRMLYTSDDSEVIPFAFKRTLYRYAPIFSDGRQHDTQEFLLFLLDGLQEDLNRIIKKPYIVRPDSTDEMVHNKAELCKLADEHWRIFKARNDSVITDLFAAMYKSTIVCPDCGKVSITFDPFTNLTLQLPKWQMESYVVHFFPLRQKPVKLDLEVSENSPVSDLRKLGVSKTGVDSDRLVMGEISQSKVFAMCDDAEMVSDFESSSSYLALFELESAPTDYVSETPEGATMRNLTPDFDSPRADRMLIPIFNRSLFAKSPNRPKTNQFFGPPSFIVVAREEAHDFDAIFRKVLAKVSTLTTRDFLNEDGQEEVIHEDSGTDVDDTDSADSKIKASSVEGEDGIVDISVRKEADKEAAGAEVLLGGRIPERLRNLFDIKVIDAGASVPVGPSIFENQRFRPMVSPEDRRASSRQGKKRDSMISGEHKTSNGSDDSGNTDNASESDSDTYRSASRRSSLNSEPDASPLIRPGEGIVLDFSEETYDALFGGRAGDGEPHGTLAISEAELITYPDITKARALRKRRASSGIPLEDCIDAFKKEEKLSEANAWHCPRCKENRRAKKKFDLWTSPDILVIHLKRFSSTGVQSSKLKDLVSFPITGLDLTGSVAAPEEGKSLVYDLFAVDDHTGGTWGGHYTAAAKSFMDDRWYEYNDSYCFGPINPRRVVSPSAYLLFYRRRSDRPLGGKILEQITVDSRRDIENELRSDSDSDFDSEKETSSTTGEARRLGDFSRNGSPSASAGAGAAHRAGDGGVQAEAADDDDDDDDDDDGKDNDKDSCSSDDILGNPDAQQGMNHNNGDDTGHGTLSEPFAAPQEDDRQLDKVSHAHESSSQVTAAPASISDGENNGLFEDEDDDDASNRADDGGDDSSDPDYQLESLGSFTDGAADSDATFAASGPVETRIPPPLEADDEDDMAVVELTVDQDEKLHSD